MSHRENELLELTKRRGPLSDSGIPSLVDQVAATNFNDIHRAAIQNKGVPNQTLPDVSFVDGGKSLDYRPKQLGPASFSLGIKYIDANSQNETGLTEKLKEKARGIVEGFTSTLNGQISTMASDRFAVNNGIIKAGETALAAADYCADKITRSDVEGVVNDLTATGMTIKAASDSYTNATPREQGIIIGAAMTNFIPLPQLAKETERATESAAQLRVVSKSADLMVDGTDEVSRSGEKFLDFAEKLGDAVLKLEPHEKTFIKDKR